MIVQELKNWKAEAHATDPILYRYNMSKKEVNIYTPQPGWLIGLHGCLFDKHSSILKDKLGQDVSINIIETSWNII